MLEREQAVGHTPFGKGRQALVPNAILFEKWHTGITLRHLAGIKPHISLLDWHAQHQQLCLQAPSYLHLTALGVCFTLPSLYILRDRTSQRGKEGSRAFLRGCLKRMATAAVSENSLQAGSSTDITCDSAVLPAPKGPWHKASEPGDVDTRC